MPAGCDGATGRVATAAEGADPVSTLDLISGAGELYDLQQDPAEIDNRFGDAAMGAVQRELREMIASRPDDACAPLPQVGMT